MWLIDVDVEDAAVGRNLFGACGIQSRGGAKKNPRSGAFGLFGRGVFFCRRDSLGGGLRAPGDGTLGGSGVNNLVARDGPNTASGGWLQFSFCGSIWSSLGSFIVKYSRGIRFSFRWRRTILCFWLIWFACHWKHIVHFFLIKSRIEFRLLFLNDLGFLLFFLCLCHLFASELKLGSLSLCLHLNFVSSNAAYSHLSHLIIRRSYTSTLLLTPSCSSTYIYTYPYPCLSLFSLNKVLCLRFQFRYQVNFIVNGWIRRFQFNKSIIIIIWVKLQQVVVRFWPRHVEVIVVRARLLVMHMLLFWALQQLMTLLLFDDLFIEIRAQSARVFFSVAPLLKLR